MLRRYLASTFALLVLAFGVWIHSTLRPPSRKALVSASAPFKVFVIGLTKTGTTSIGDALERLGHKRSGWHEMRSRWLYHGWTLGDLRPLISHTESGFDAFEDIPWPQAYRVFADLYPSAKFILSLRRDEGTWLKSIERHTAGRPWIGHRDLYGCYEATSCRSSYLEAYRNHTIDVLDFFAKRNEQSRLLVFAIDRPREEAAKDRGHYVDEKWRVLVEFLNYSRIVDQLGGLEELGSFPHSNKRGHRVSDPRGWIVSHCIVAIENLAVSAWFSLRQLHTESTRVDR